MSFFSDILQKLKKPVDALKNFLTPKEKKSMEFKVGEGLTPEQRVKAEAVLKKSAPDKLAYVPELGYAPYKSPTKEMIAQLFGEGPRTSTIPEASKKVGSAILQFGKDVLRAGPRAAASVTLEAQGRRKMIPETKAERFLFGEEPLESITERIERFPERAKEFGISEPTSKKIAPFAVLGLTALDILPPLPGKAGLKGVAKKALTTKTAKEFAIAITKKETDEILKAGFKSVDDFFKVAKNPAAKTSLKIVDELKAAASTKKELESLVNPLVDAKKQGYKVTNISNTSLGKQKGFAYRIEKGMDKMYAKNEAEIADLIKPGSRTIPAKLQPTTTGEIPKAIMDEAQSAKNFALSKINDKEWMSGASKVSQDMVSDNSKKSVQQIAKEKFDYLKYRAGMVDKDGYPLDKAAQKKLAEVTESSIPKELESLMPQAQKHKDISSFIKEISGDTYAPEYRNPLADFWRKKYIQPLSKGSKATFTTDVVAFERNLDDVLGSKYAKDKLANMSVRQKAEIVNGKKWTDLYGDMLENNIFKFQQDFFKTAKAATPAQAKPTDVLKEAVSKTVHAKKLETGIDEAYRALEKAGKDEVYNLGKVGDYITDSKVRDQYKDVLDTPLYIKKQMHMGKAHGSLSVDPKGNPAIVLSDGLTKDMIDRTLVEELTHAKQFRKGVRPTKGVSYKEIPEEMRAKKAAKHFAPKTTLEDLIEEAGLHRAKAKQFSNNDLEKEFVARQMGVAEGIEKAIDNIKSAQTKGALYTTNEATKQKGIEMLTKSFGDKESAIGHANDFWAKEGKPGVFYHATKEGAPFAFEKSKAANMNTGLRSGVSNLNGLYVGRDPKALHDFYNLAAERGENLITYKGNPKLLDLTDEKTMQEFVKKFKTGNQMEKEIARRGYDGIKYFDPYATGEEIVITNQNTLKAVAFNEKPIAAVLKPVIRKELDKTYENIPDFVKKRYPNAEFGRRILEEGYERGLTLSKQTGDIQPNTPVTSYHGTIRKSAEAIKKSGFKVPEAETFAESGGRKYGEGVYLQPADEGAITSSLFYGKRADPKGMGADLAVLETEFIPKKPFVINTPQKFMPFGSNEWGAFIHKTLEEPTINDSITAYLKNRPARLKVDAALRKAGYDSVILKAEGKADLVVALNPNDVKITNIYKDADGSLETFRKGYQKAFRDTANKPASAIAELKSAAKLEIPKIKGAKVAEDLSKSAKAAPGSKVQEIIGEYQKRINTTPAKKAATPISKTLDDTYTAIIDRFHPITKLARKATELRPGENPELLARRYLGVQGIAESKLFWNTTRLTAEGNLEVTGPGLSKILKPAKNNIDDLRTLIIAERDIELSKRTLESGKKVIGTTPQKSKEVINALKQKYGTKGFEQISKTAQGIREWSRKALLDPLLDVGAISKEQYNTITKSNEFYVPFQRVIEELETHGFVPKKANIFSPKSVPVKKLKGSTKDIIDPFESMITNAYKVTDFVERARVGRSIANLRNVSPELADMIKPMKPKIVPVAKQGEELIFRPSFFTPEKNTMMVFENGKRKFYQVPEDVFKAVSGMMESDVGAIMKMLAFPARTLRAGATLTPEFMGRNPFRDQFTAFVFSKYGYVPGVDLVKGVFNTIGKTDLHGRWLAGGGAQSMLVSLDRVTSQATLAKVLGAKDIKGMVKNPLEALRILSEFGEKGTRVGAFGRAVKKGVSDLEAAFESRDITLDFARRGSQTRAVNMMVAFWNAQVQGLNKMVRAFRERPMQTTFKAASGITLPSVLLYLNNRNDPRYQELPQWQKDLFWIIPVGDKGPIIRIPKPFEVGVIFGTVPEHILTWIDKNDPEALTSVAKTLMESSAPGYIPTGLQPIIENVANYSFFRQRPIVSEGQQALPKEMQAGRYTSETAKEIGKLIKQSPAKIENLFMGYTGGLGQYALDASDKLLKTLGVVSPPSEPTKTLADQPFIRAFVAREPIGSGSESVNKFYKIYDESNATKAAVKGLAEEGKEQEAITYLRSHPAGFYTKGLNKVAHTFSDLRKKRDAVLDSRDLTPEQKKRAVDALDKIMTEIARQTVELVESSNEKFHQ